MDYSYIPVQITILADIFLFSIALQHKVADNEKKAWPVGFTATAGYSPQSGKGL